MRTERLDRQLDEALEMTFPASDPITVYIPDVDADSNGTSGTRDESSALHAPR